MLVFVLTGIRHIALMIRIAGTDDLIFATRFRRGRRSTAKDLKEARSKKAYYFDLTNASTSPILRFSCEYLVTRNEGELLRRSGVSPFAISEVLIAACADIRRGRMIKLLDYSTKEQRHRYRWYKD
jgi:DNA-binding MurR/RpiR family transcriptional regulator